MHFDWMWHMNTRCFVIFHTAVHSNGFTSPDVHGDADAAEDDDECSSHASSSDWTPQPQIGMTRVNFSLCSGQTSFVCDSVNIHDTLGLCCLLMFYDVLCLGSYRFIQQHIMRGTDPRAILRDLLPETVLPPDLDDMTLWQIIINISEPPKRKKRKDINTLEDVVRLLNESKKILVLTGAGVSFPNANQSYYVWFFYWSLFILWMAFHF